MSRTTKTALSLVGAALLAGCGLSAERAIHQLEATPPTGDTFHQTLAAEYLALAEKEYSLVDYRDAEYFGQKGLVASQGQATLPTELSERSLLSEFVEDASTLRSRTVAFVDINRASDPVEAATAQALFDCMLEEYEEYWQVEVQPYWLSGCRDALLVLLDQEALPATIALEGDVLFDFNRAEIKPEFTGVLDDVASLLANSGEILVLEGHTDSVGSAAYNMRLGQRRADAVAAYLAGRGVPAGNMTTTSFGEERPVAPNDTAEGRSLNRRVEIKR
ncbi:MAG: OmpA family protein [Pseudomonadota bacterium]